MTAFLRTNAVGIPDRRVTPEIATERMARALHADKHPFGPGHPRDPMSDWGALSEGYRNEFRAKARKALAAMWEPVR